MARMLDPDNMKKALAAAAEKAKLEAEAKERAKQKALEEAQKELQAKVDNSAERKRSLSPLGMKLAMQNNAWEPPDNIKTGGSFIKVDDDPLKVSTGKSPPSVNYVSSDESATEVAIIDPEPKKPAPVKSKRNSVVPSFVIGSKPVIRNEEADKSTYSLEVDTKSDIDGNVILQDPPPTNNKSELDRQFELMMDLNPQNPEDIKAFSVSLVVLAKRYSS